MGIWMSFLTPHHQCQRTEGTQNTNPNQWPGLVMAAQQGRPLYINYSKTTKTTYCFIDVTASRRKPSPGPTSGAGHQYVKACPIRGSTGSSP